jgi:type II secretory pathway component PulF
MNLGYPWGTLLQVGPATAAAFVDLDRLWKAWTEWLYLIYDGLGEGRIYARLVLLGFAALILTVMVVWSLSGAPRWRARTRLVVRILEQCVRTGRSVEAGLVELAGSGDPAVGRRLRRLAILLELGVPLEEALRREPRLLLPEVAATLRAGLRLGDLQRILPLCRDWLDAPRPRLAGSIAYLAWLAFGLAPATTLWSWISTRSLVTSFAGVVAEYDLDGSIPLSGWTDWARMGFLLSMVGTAIGLATLALVLAGPWSRPWLQTRRLPWFDALLWRLPWHRKRSLRTFTMVLATLLDAGMPEPEAVRMAAECTGQEILRRRARVVEEALTAGCSLPRALGRLESRGELEWRLNNAARSQEGFTAALRGWEQSLAAQAAVQEQVAAQLLVCSLIVLSGLWVAGNAWVVFGTLAELCAKV